MRLAVIAGLLIPLIVAAYFAKREFNAEEFLARSIRLEGKTRAECFEALGQPEAVLNSEEYAKKASDIAVSYEPDPPPVWAGEALVYRRGLRLVVVFLAAGKVARVYSGLT